MKWNAKEKSSKQKERLSCRMDLSFYQSQNEEKQAAIVKCYVKRYRRAKMSGLQKRYYAKLYRIGKLKKKPYSQVWKYKDDIRKMHKLQEQYLFLVRHKIESAEELVSVLDNLTDKKKEASKEKSKTYKAKERFKDIFDKVEQIRGLDDAVNSLAADMVISPNVRTADMAVAGGGSVSSADLNSLVGAIKEAVGGISVNNGDIVIPVYLGGTMLDEVIVNAQQRANLRSGGR